MNVRLQYPMSFTAGVYYDGALRMNNYHMRLFMTTATEDPESHNIAFERILYFVTMCVESTIMINQDEVEQCQKLQAAGLSITTLPAEPVDQVVGMMLYCKLSAVMEGRIAITDFELSSDLGDQIIYMHSDNETMGPFEAKGWWHNADLTHSDTSEPSSENVMSLNLANPWADAELAWPVADKSTGNTIVFADFGKNDSR